MLRSLFLSRCDSSKLRWSFSGIRVPPWKYEALKKVLNVHTALSCGQEVQLISLDNSGRISTCDYHVVFGKHHNLSKDFKTPHINAIHCHTPDGLNSLNLSRGQPRPSQPLDVWPTRSAHRTPGGNTVKLTNTWRFYVNEHRITQVCGSTWRWGLAASLLFPRASVSTNHSKLRNPRWKLVNPAGVPFLEWISIKLPGYGRYFDAEAGPNFGGCQRDIKEAKDPINPETHASFWVLKCLSDFLLYSLKIIAFSHTKKAPRQRTPEQQGLCFAGKLRKRQWFMMQIISINCLHLNLAWLCNAIIDMCRILDHFRRRVRRSNMLRPWTGSFRKLMAPVMWIRLQGESRTVSAVNLTHAPKLRVHEFMD